MLKVSSGEVTSSEVVCRTVTGIIVTGAVSDSTGVGSISGVTCTPGSDGWSSVVFGSSVPGFSCVEGVRQWDLST